MDTCKHLCLAWVAWNGLCILCRNSIPCSFWMSWIFLECRDGKDSVRQHQWSQKVLEIAERNWKRVRKKLKEKMKFEIGFNHFIIVNFYWQNSSSLYFLGQFKWMCNQLCRIFKWLLGKPFTVNGNVNGNLNIITFIKSNFCGRILCFSFTLHLVIKVFVSCKPSK